jgi:hypothetical protein
MIEKRKIVSIVVPFFDEGEGVKYLYQAICHIFDQVPNVGFEVVCVDDGNHDDTLKKLIALVDRDPRFHVVEFSRNFGKESFRCARHIIGRREHHLPAEYHGNPVDPGGGALCFRYLGWELLDKLRTIGFSLIWALAYWSGEQSYLGKEKFLFMAEKVAAHQ